MSESDMDDLGPDVPRKVFDCGCLARGGKIVHARMDCPRGHQEHQVVNMDSGDQADSESP